MATRRRDRHRWDHGAQFLPPAPAPSKLCSDPLSTTAPWWSGGPISPR
ncbi:hypothetical protein MBH78_04045 [Oceanimonas sp. NS1]|nr:hypothetical protein [Oceanimonas sp. NS1]